MFYYLDGRYRFLHQDSIIRPAVAPRSSPKGIFEDIFHCSDTYMISNVFSLSITYKKSYPETSHQHIVTSSHPP